METVHQSVLLNETVDSLLTDPEGVYVDGTLGGGGHAELICERLEGGGRLLALDRDPEALKRAKERLKRFSDKVICKQVEFGRMAQAVQDEGIETLQGVVLDLGFSSDQIDSPARGFSFRHDAPLDMRMNPSDELTAATVINEWSEDELKHCFREFGEERHAARIARMVVERREDKPWSSTVELAQAIENLHRGGYRRIHPATRVFQALRMAVNRERDELQRGLISAANLLGDGGRLAVISFHSIEDRITKHFMKDHVQRWENLQEGGRRPLGKAPLGTLITKTPITASEEEQMLNPRSRSAKLRVWQRSAV